MKRKPAREGIRRKPSVRRLAAGLLALLLSSFFLLSCGVKPVDKRVVLTLDGEKIYYDYFRYVFLNTRDDMDGGDHSYWKDNVSAGLELSDRTMEVLLRNKAITELAKEYDIRLTREQKKEIDDYIKASKEEFGGEEAFKKSLEASYMTEYSLRYVQNIVQLWSDLYHYVTSEANGVIRCSDEILLDDIPKNFRRIEYVMIRNDETDDKEENASLAESVRERALTGEDFAGLIKEYGEDETMSEKLKDGYYYTVGGIVREVEEAVEELAEGEISEVIDMGYALFVIHRLPIEDSYVKDNMEEFRESYCARIFNEMVAEKASKIKVKYRDLYGELTVFSVE